MSKIKLKITPMDENVLTVQFLSITDSFAKREDRTERPSFTAAGLDGRRWKMICFGQPAIAMDDKTVELWCSRNDDELQRFQVASYRFADKEMRTEFIKCLMQFARDFANNWKSDAEKEEEQSLVNLENGKSLTIEA